MFYYKTRKVIGHVFVLEVSDIVESGVKHHKPTHNKYADIMYVQHMLCCVLVLFFVVLVTKCCQFLWIVHSRLHLRFSLFFYVRSCQYHFIYGVGLNFYTIVLERSDLSIFFIYHRGVHYVLINFHRHRRLSINSPIIDKNKLNRFTLRRLAFRYYDGHFYPACYSLFFVMRIGFNVII
jgi:hypothetical protein